MAADGMSSVISLGSVEMLRNERRKRATENAEAHGWAAEMKRNMRRCSRRRRAAQVPVLFASVFLPGGSSRAAHAGGPTKKKDVRGRKFRNDVW